MKRSSIYLLPRSDPSCIASKRNFLLFVNYSRYCTEYLTKSFFNNYYKSIYRDKMKIENFNNTTTKQQILLRSWSSSKNAGIKTIDNRKMATIIDGKKIASDIRSELNEEVTKWIECGNRAPKLVCILVGNNAASEVYVSNKVKAAKEVGIVSETKHLPEDMTQVELLSIIKDLNEDKSVDGILVQLPLPEQMCERTICDAISYKKDVDGFSGINIGRCCLDMKTLVPCTAIGVYELLKRYKIPSKGKNAVVIGRSKNVGMPISMLLHTDGAHASEGLDATVTICHRYTPHEQLVHFCRTADIIVSATGIPHLIKADMIKPGACVIDVGITRIKTEGGKDKLVGDVDFENAKEVAGFITPVPGGVGPMTVAMLMKNTLLAAKGLVQ